MSGPRVHAVFGNPRAGTTWIAETVAKMTGASLLFEPLNVWGGLRTDGEMPRPDEYKLADVARLGFWYYQPIPVDADWPAAEAFFRRLFAAEITPDVLHERFNTHADTHRAPASAPALTIKFCYAHLMLPWLLARFDVRGIFVLRHPCAVVASQMRQEGWRKLAVDARVRLPRFRHDEVLAAHLPALARVRTPTEHMAAFWALTVRHVLEHAAGHPRLLVLRFEDVLADRLGVLERIAAFLGAELTSALVASSHAPSFTCERPAELAKIASSDDWRDRLAAEEVDRIMTTVDRFDTADVDLLRHAAGGPS